MNHDTYPDSYIREILNGVKSIAMVGASPVNVRPSYFAFKYLAQRGYDMIPVNPGHVGKSLLGQTVRRLARRHRPPRRHDRHLPQFEPHHAGGRGGAGARAAAEGDLDAARRARRRRGREGAKPPASRS